MTIFSMLDKEASMRPSCLQILQRTRAAMQPARPPVSPTTVAASACVTGVLQIAAPHQIVQQYIQREAEASRAAIRDNAHSHPAAGVVFGRTTTKRA